MRRSALLAIAVVAVCVFVAYAQEDASQGDQAEQQKTEQIPSNAVGLPHDFPPQHALASVADGRLLLVRFSFELQQREAVTRIEANGSVEIESVVRHAPVGYAHSSWHRLEEIGAYVDGQEVPAALLAKKLGKSTHVLIATKKLDPFYLDVIKPGTIQLVLPASLVYQPATPAGGMGEGFF